MKKKLIAAALLVMGIAILSAGTIAYFTSQTTAHNVITSGGVDITLEEWADEDCTTPYPTDKAVPVMPGESITKIVTVKNTDADAFVRAQFHITVLDADGDQIDPEDLPNLDKAIVIECGADWQKGADGWYYYAEPLKVGQVTPPLFSEVVFDGPNMTNEYQNCTVTVDVIAQAVQVANNGESALDAQGWPEA